MSSRPTLPAFVRLTRREDLPVLVSLYVRAFAEPPWEEENIAFDVRTDFERYIAASVVFVSAVADQKVIGGAVAFPIGEMPKVLSLLSATEREDFYMAELFIAPEYRQRRAGYLLTLARMAAGRDRGFRRFAVRTSVNQPAIINMYQRHFGATIAAYDNVVSPKLRNGKRVMEADTRVILVGNIPD